MLSRRQTVVGVALLVVGLIVAILSPVAAWYSLGMADPVAACSAPNRLPQPDAGETVDGQRTFLPLGITRTYSTAEFDVTDWHQSLPLTRLTAFGVVLWLAGFVVFMRKPRPQRS